MAETYWFFTEEAVNGSHAVGYVVSDDFSGAAQKFLIDNLVPSNVVVYGVAASDLSRIERAVAVVPPSE